MPQGFWYGLLALPAAVVAVCVAAAAVFGLIYASESWSVGSYKLWPHRTQREVVTATVACAKSVRYLWVPGWHVVICRTAFYDATDLADRERHLVVQRAVRTALAAEQAAS